MIHSTRCWRFMLALVSVPLVAAAVTAAEDSLVPERYIITKSDPHNGSDTDPNANCTPHGDVSVSCPGRDGGRLFDKVGPSSMNANWKMSHHWRPSQSGEDVQVELVFAWPVTISETAWKFFLGMNSGFPPSSNWSVTAIAENGRDNISQYIAGSHKSVGPSYIVNMSNFDGFPASRQWRFIIPLPASNELFLYEVSISGKVKQIVPQSYSINASHLFSNTQPDNGTGCLSIENERINCTTPGRLFDNFKPETTNLSLFHVWYMRSEKDVQLVLMFQEAVVIGKIVWTFYYNNGQQPNIPVANITQWNLTAFNGIDQNISEVNVTRKTIDSHLLVYTMVVQSSLAAQRWGITFSAQNRQWLFLGEVEIFGSNAEHPSPSPSATVPFNAATSGMEMSTPSIMELPTLSTAESPTLSTMGSPAPSTNPTDSSGTSPLITVVAILAGVICLLILCVLAVILALTVKMCQARWCRHSDSDKGTPSPEAVYSEIPLQNSYGMPPVDLSKLPGYSGGRGSRPYEKPPVIDYANNETILKIAISGRVSPVYDEPEKYRITDLSRSMPMIAHLNAAHVQDRTVDRSRCRTESPSVWYRDSVAAESVGSLTSLPPGFANALAASPSTGQENGYHELQPSDGEDSEDSAFRSLVNPEHKYATLEHAELEDEDDAPDGTESMSEESVSSAQCEMGVDSPTGVREPPYAKPQRKIHPTSSADEVPPVHMYSLPDRSSRKSLPLGEQDLVTGDMTEDNEDASAA